MLDSGGIEPTTGEWSAPILLVPKDWSLKICVDYRHLNSMAKTITYPMSRVDGIVDELGAAKYMTALNLTRVYRQVQVAVVDHAKVTFVTQFSLYQFKVILFGLEGAPSICQQLMDQIIQEKEKFTSAYLDYLIIYSRSLQEHLEHYCKFLSGEEIIHD